MKYRNISTQDLSVIGVGVVRAGEVIDTKTVINNPNFELVKKPDPEAKPKPTASTEVKNN